MKFFNPYIIFFLTLFAITGVSAIYVFIKGLRTSNRPLLITGFILSAVAGGFFDFTLQIIRIAIYFGHGSGT